MRAQQLIGYVSTKDADVTGATDVMDGKAVLAGSVSVTAKDRTAEITLGRGGTVHVCQTSVLHVTESRAAELAAPLLFSLDRGAIEIQMMATASDAVMTPDLRFAVRGGGPLDLRMRIARNGDTCVENRGAAAPTLAVSDPFGEALYELEPGQHVLFEHGSLHEVVDHETSPCGCPDSGMSVAEALLAPGVGAGRGREGCAGGSEGGCGASVSGGGERGVGAGGRGAAGPAGGGPCAGERYAGVQRAGRGAAECSGECGPGGSRGCASEGEAVEGPGACGGAVLSQDIWRRIEVRRQTEGTGDSINCGGVSSWSVWGLRIAIQYRTTTSHAMGRM